VLKLGDLVARREGPLGDLLADGARAAARRLGRESERYVVHVKGLEVAMHDPRAMRPMSFSDTSTRSSRVQCAEIEAYVERYQRYLGRGARRDGAARVFDLQESCVRLIPASGLREILPNETAPALPAFVAYAVAVRDPGSTRRWLENNGLVVNAEPSGGIFVPARAALGAAVIFRQVEERS